MNVVKPMPVLEDARDRARAVPIDRDVALPPEIREIGKKSRFGRRIFAAAAGLLLLGGLAVAMPVGGLLDALTLGSPFQSIWLNFARNSIDGISTGMGVEPAGYYFGYLAVALHPLPILGAFRSAPETYALASRAASRLPSA